jgi:hypothetical protein
MRISSLLRAALAPVAPLLVLLAPLGAGVSPPATAAALAGPQPGAYWLVASDGGVFTYGGVLFEGSAGALPLRQPVVGIAPTSDGAGYWLVASDGGIFSYGDAAYHGSTPALPAASRPTSPVVAIAATASGQGYWVVTSNGSVYAFGDAPFFGSEGGHPLAAPIVGMAATTDGAGYWLVASDGGIFAFGDAVFLGSAGALRLHKPIVGMAATTDGAGYWLVASDGGIFAYGDAGFHGSTGGIKLNAPVVSMASSPDGGGYWLVASDGGIFSFGDAPFRGSAGALRLRKPIVAMAAGHTQDPYQPGASGYDVSWPQCVGSLPGPGFGFAVVGVNNGSAFTRNPCLKSELAWASSAPLVSVYINLNAPPPQDPHALNGPAGRCVGNDTGCMAYNYGYNAAVDAYAYGVSQGASAGVWWLDVETGNTWDSSQFNNSRTIQGALDALGASGAVAGIYSTYLQFPQIAGGYAPAVPIWVPYSDPSRYSIDAYCTNPSLGFGGGKVWLVQSQTSGVPFDQDHVCAT